MPQKDSPTISSLLLGFKYAFQGLRVLITERNMQIHIAAAILVIGAAWYFVLNPLEWALILGCIGLVMAAEAFNTALEYMCDYIQPEHDPKIGQIKDLAAAGVFIAAFVSGAIGLIIFLPKIT